MRRGPAHLARYNDERVLHVASDVRGMDDRLQLQAVVCMKGSTTVHLRDGSIVALRSIRADDGDRLQAAIGAMSREGRYSRFFSAMAELPGQMLDRATHPDFQRELQLVAVVQENDAERIVAGTRYTAVEPDGDCEFAMAVVDAWQGRGLARILLESLMRAARERGFIRMQGEVLRSNLAMLGLAKRLGFEVAGDAGDPSVLLVRRDLTKLDEVVPKP